jgi:signal peptidase I
MSEANSTTSSNSTNLQVVRETVESLAVAFVLALLFKAFIAEAFVIPTGSMAPTLMGAHKDIRCEECGYQYQCGASNEYNDVGANTGSAVVGTTCPLCRKPQVADPSVDANQATFSGDRILVSKLAYTFSQPRRWDVIVFKFIEEARLNYIKRCIGRPNEAIRIREGNIYIQQKQAEGDSSVASPYEIARKPPHVVNAMLQPLSDSKYVPKSLVKAGMPSPWQPFPAKESTWDVKQSETAWSASIANVPSGATHWLRYYHRVIDPVAWESVNSRGAFPAPIAPQSSRLITDFTAYNASYATDASTRSKINPERYRESVSDLIRDSNQRGFARRPLENDGIHWTGDLATEIDIKTTPGTEAIALLLVESGVEHECRIDLKSGIATVKVLLNGQPVDAFQGKGGNLAKEASAPTSVRAGGRHRIRFANVDDTLTLWIDGTAVRWDPSGNLVCHRYLPFAERTPKTTDENPLDAAPIAVGVVGGGAELFRTQTFRDIYYIAQGNRNQALFDYPDIFAALRQSSTAKNNARYALETHNSTPEALGRFMSQEGISRNALLSNPALWAESTMGCGRQTVEFRMEKDWYFPMGDNSAASSDARSWGHTPERLMIGRAVMVFWPHYWNAPVPFLPNVQRMGLIR